MNSITGLAVLKNSFTWKFSKYPRFHKKVKLQIQEKTEGEEEPGKSGKRGVRVPWPGGHEAYTVVGVGPSNITPCWQFESPAVPASSADSIADDTSTSGSSDNADYSTIQYSSISLESDEPLYENTIGFLEPQSPILVSYDAEDDVEDHIYDYVDSSPVNTRPADIFLSLVDEEGTTISPDPNIYEVPPGAIFNTEARFEDLFPFGEISPPRGFQDKLTWERFRVIANGDDDNEAIYSLPIKFSLSGSTIVRQKKKKFRPGIDELLGQITVMKDNTMEEEQKVKVDAKEEISMHMEPTKDLIAKDGIPSPLEMSVEVTNQEACTISISSCPDTNEVIVESINQAIPSNLTVLQANVDSSQRALDGTLPQETESTQLPSTKEFTSVIEISGDGTWNTAKVPVNHIEMSKNSELHEASENAEQDFLSGSSDARAKHVNLAYSGQYYTSNCPVASIKPMKHDDNAVLDAKKNKNIGAQIMEKYEEERKKLIDSKNLPEVSLLDVDESLEEIQMERRKIIESQAVRAKRIDSWIKGRAVTLDENGLPIKPEEDCEMDEAESMLSSPEHVNMYLDENGEVVYDSIIQNKNKIKSYWEQLMLAAELANQRTPTKSFTHHSPSHTQSPAKPPAAAPQTPQAPAPPAPPAPHHVVSPDLSEAEFYDALSHVSAAQTPDLVDKDGDILKSTETVVERDIRIQQERELALMIEREKALKTAKDKMLKTVSPKLSDKDELGSGSVGQSDEAYLSIPTTDEGNFSEYGSEDKEDHSPDGSRVMSPVGTAGITSHHRTQSLDSMSSGHSSGSGSASHPDLSVGKPRQTFGPVKPLDEPDDIDILSYVKENDSAVSKDRITDSECHDVEVNVSETGYEKETPIEREIRLVREREDELRREKMNSTTTSLDHSFQKSEFEKKKDSPRVTTLRVSPATQRVQQEIEMACQREKELKRWTSDDPQKDAVPVPKVVIKPAEKKITSSPSIQVETKTVQAEVAKTVSEPPKTSFVKNGGASPKIYIQNPQQKGLMKRFLAARGKMGSSPRLNSLPTPSPTAPSMPTLKTPALSPSSLFSEPFFSFTSLVQTKEGEEPLNLGTRPGYKSAEDKIQSELREMKKREEELRQIRRSNLYSARSQPDLLNMINDPMSEREYTESHEDEDTRLPTMSKLRSALSVQNLLDIDDKPVPKRMPKRKSALIEQWENMIQNNN